MASGARCGLHEGGRFYRKSPWLTSVRFGPPVDFPGRRRCRGRRPRATDDRVKTLAAALLLVVLLAPVVAPALESLASRVEAPGCCPDEAPAGDEPPGAPCVPGLCDCACCPGRIAGPSPLPRELAPLESSVNPGYPRLRTAGPESPPRRVFHPPKS